MRFSYTAWRAGFTSCAKQATVAIGLLAMPFSLWMKTVSAEQPAPKSPEPIVPTAPTAPKADPRTLRLVNFFSRLHCPVQDLADEFIHAADENRLDWRLLPGISVIESGGGKAYRNNNIFGWNNGQQLFPSISSGIKTVAYKLGRAPLYRDRDSVGKLRVYNPDDESYVRNVLNVMNRISPVVNVRSQHSALAYQRN